MQTIKRVRSGFADAYSMANRSLMYALSSLTRVWFAAIDYSSFMPVAALCSRKCGGCRVYANEVKHKSQGEMVYVKSWEEIQEVRISHEMLPEEISHFWNHYRVCIPSTSKSLIS